LPRISRNVSIWVMSLNKYMLGRPFRVQICSVCMFTQMSRLETSLIRAGRSLALEQIVLAKSPTEELPLQRLPPSITHGIHSLDFLHPHLHPRFFQITTPTHMRGSHLKYHKCGHGHCTAPPLVCTSKFNPSFRHKDICAIVCEDTVRVKPSLTDSKLATCERPHRHLD
jgi:hypothetical protein